MDRPLLLQHRSTKAGGIPLWDQIPLSAFPRNVWAFMKAAYSYRPCFWIAEAVPRDIRLSIATLGRSILSCRSACSEYSYLLYRPGTDKQVAIDAIRTTTCTSYQLFPTADDEDNSCEALSPTITRGTSPWPAGTRYCVTVAAMPFGRGAQQHHEQEMRSLRIMPPKWPRDHEMLASASFRACSLVDRRSRTSSLRGTLYHSDASR